MRNLEIKRGSVFQVTLSFADGNNAPFDISQVTVSGEVRDPRGVLVAQLTLQPVSGTPGVGTVTVADTSAWPLGLLKADLLISDGVLPTISETFGINVVPSVTYSAPAQAPYNPVTS